MPSRAFYVFPSYLGASVLGGGRLRAQRSSSQACISMIGMAECYMQECTHDAQAGGAQSVPSIRQHMQVGRSRHMRPELAQPQMPRRLHASSRASSTAPSALTASSGGADAGTEVARLARPLATTSTRPRST